jgi:hypothetical protein
MTIVAHNTHTHTHTRARARKNAISFHTRRLHIPHSILDTPCVFVGCRYSDKEGACQNKTRLYVPSAPSAPDPNVVVQPSAEASIWIDVKAGRLCPFALIIPRPKPSVTTHVVLPHRKDVSRIEVSIHHPALGRIVGDCACVVVFGETCILAEDEILAASLYTDFDQPCPHAPSTNNTNVLTDTTNVFPGSMNVFSDRNPTRINIQQKHQCYCVAPVRVWPTCWNLSTSSSDILSASLTTSSISLSSSSSHSTSILRPAIALSELKRHTVYQHTLLRQAEECALK